MFDLSGGPFSSDGRGWFLASICVAILLESVGFVSIAIHARSLTNHLAFFASFSATLVAPSLLAIANASSFMRLMSQIACAAQLAGFKSSSRPYITVHIFNALQIIVLVALGSSIYDISSYLSPKPIQGIEGAMQRLAHYERAMSVLTGAHVLSLMGFIAFGLVLATYTLLPQSSRSRQEKSMLLAINAINGLCAVRTAWKICQYAFPREDTVRLVDHGLPFWLCDALPIVLALSVFCAVSLEAESPQISPLDISVGGRLVPSYASPDEKVDYYFYFRADEAHEKA